MINKTTIIERFEQWWDKYKVTLEDIDQACEASDNKMKSYLKELGYAGS